ncbi:MAG: Crp/Fnr family transcriptional regulator [Deltaproteobacteria bacterium]|nr:Crp/Fnr family transcriptional regulator [Deltaproteobacteria bacterium]
MVSLQDLKRIAVFEDLTDGMLERLAPIAQTESMEERQMVYEEGSAADRFFSLIRGKVLLEAELAPNFIISVGSIKPGYSFGWPALFPSGTNTSYAVCAEPSEILMMPGDKLSEILNDDQKMGFLVMQKSARILENRLEHRTAQFLKVISRHPEIGALLGL